MKITPEDNKPIAEIIREILTKEFTVDTERTILVKRISAPKGNTGHGACDVQMLLKLW